MKLELLFVEPAEITQKKELPFRSSSLIMKKVTTYRTTSF